MGWRWARGSLATRRALNQPTFSFSPFPGPGSIPARWNYLIYIKENPVYARRAITGPCGARYYKEPCGATAIDQGSF